MKQSLILIPLVLSAAACACGAFQADPLPEALRATGQRYFVENHGSDDRHLERVIATELGKHGVSVTSGSAADLPEDVDVIVLYEDRWQSESAGIPLPPFITYTFLSYIRIDLRDPETNVLLATGSLYQVLAQKDEQKVIAAIVAGMFK
jgi:hypothetical protein